MAARTLQYLLTGHGNRFGPDRIFTLQRTVEGLEVGLVHADDSKERLVIAEGSTLEAGGERWLVRLILPGGAVSDRRETSGLPHAVAQLELVG